MRNSATGALIPGASCIISDTPGRFPGDYTVATLSLMADQESLPKYVYKRG